VPKMGTGQTSTAQLKGAEMQERAADTPFVRIEPSHGWVSLRLRELWEYRELLYFLVWRDVKVRYKQSAIGVTWAILQPLMTMLIFTVVFSKFANVPSDGLPYPIFSFVALLPWNYFSTALNRGITSVVANANLVSKIYFPRLIMPLSGVVSGIVDFAIGFILLAGMMVWYKIAPTWGILAVPAFFLLAMVTALAVGLWLSALNVRYRDVGQAIPFLTQIWMYASPVGYPVSLVPEKWRLLYNLNPMAGVIEGFRWALLGKESPDFGVIAVSALIVVPLLWGGIVFFKRMERTFPDVV
jgi:lipopolysaccharide transport system permease protein